MSEYPVCPLHSTVIKDFSKGEQRMDRLEQKIDDLLEGQRLQALSFQALQLSVENGLKKDIASTMETTRSLVDKLEAVCVSYDNKFKELFPEEFDGIQYKRELEGNNSLALLS